MPGSVDLELDLAHEGRVDGVLLGKLARARARVPRETGNYRVEALERSGGLLKVRIAGEGVSLAGGLDVFPENGERFSSRAVEAQVLESGLLELRLALEPNAPPAGPLGRIHVRLGEEIFLLDLDALRGR